MAEDRPSREILKEIVERLDVLERVLKTNTARLHNIEHQVGISSEPQSSIEPAREQRSETHRGRANAEPHPSPSQVEAPDLLIPEASQPGSAEEQAGELPERNWSQPETPPPGTPATHAWSTEAASSRTYESRKQSTDGEGPPVETPENAAGASPAGKRRDLESVIGGSWFTWIGIIAVTFGVAFFLKFAFDKQWVGPGARVSLSALLGIALLYVGERLRRRELRSYAYVISGGGLLILYLADFAAFSLYHLIGHTLALLLMAAVTTTAVVLSVRLNALPVAILGLVGGFLTPVLLSTGVDNAVGLFTYVTLLDAGVLAVAYFKRWRSLDLLSFAGTVAITLGWADQFFSPEGLWTTIFFLSVFFLLYSLLAIFHNVLTDRPSGWFDVLLAIANATFYFGFSYYLLVTTGFDHAAPATQSLLLSFFFTGLFYTTWRWNPDDRLLRYNYLAVAATFLSVALAVQLELHWVTIAWAVEALMLTWVGLRLRESAARHAALALFCAAVVHWFGFDYQAFAYAVDPSFMPLLNRRALSCAVLVGAIAGAARLYKNAGELDAEERSTAKTFLMLTGNALALTLLSVDVNDYFTARLASNIGQETSLAAQIENSRQFSISALWTLYAASMLTLGLLRGSKLLRWAGLLLLLAATAKVVVLDSTYYAASWHFPVFNQTFMAYALIVALLAFTERLYGRPASSNESERRVMRPALLVTANLLALVAVSLEVFGYYDRFLNSPTLEGLSTRGFTQAFSQLQEGKRFTLVIVWTVYAMCAFLFGAWRRSQLWRWSGLLLLTFTTPLVLANLIYYDAPWHMLVLNRTLIGFAVFVAALWLVVRTYARSGKPFAETATVRPIATVAANVLAIVALSAQAGGYFDARIAEDSFNAATGLNGIERQRNLELAKQLSLSVLWALYACGLFIAGRVNRLLRVMGLVLLSLTTLKVFLVDLSALERVYRIVSFIMLGAILLIVSYFYQRSHQRAAAKESSR